MRCMPILRRALLLALAGPWLYGQPESVAPLAFEVVSVKLHPVPAGSLVMRLPSGTPRTSGNRFSDRMTTLTNLIMDAYGVQASQIFGLPRWGQVPDGDHYDIEARAEGVPTTDQLRRMLQSLLADRFQLKLHRETRELPVYALVIGKNGPKFREIGPEAPKPGKSAPRQEEDAVPKSTSAPSPVLRGAVSQLVWLLSGVVDRPVVDRTGLTGRYEFPNLDWRGFGRERRGLQPDSEDSLSVFAAIQRELGLKLEPRKDSVETLTIDRAEKPTENRRSCRSIGDGDVAHI